MTLEQILEIHVQAVRRIATTVEPGGDLAPVLGAWRDGVLVSTAIVELPTDRAARWSQHEAAMNFLRKRRAQSYTMTVSAWASGKLLSPDEFREWERSGKNVCERDDRVECVICLAGDTERTLSVEFDCVRTPMGRIAHLRRRPERPGVVKSGLFHDLLLEARGRLDA